MRTEYPLLVELSSCTAGYNGEAVLDHVNFEIRQQDFTGIIGPNGGGKTTLLKIILGLLPPREGEIRYYFQDKGRLPVGYLPQFSSWDRKFPISVRDVVLSGLHRKKGIFGRYTKEDHEHCLAILEQMGLAGLFSRPLDELSGGQAQRVFLARAVISSPELLILDEPGTFVDKDFEKFFYSELELLNRKMAILLVTHDLGTISSIVKDIACVNGSLHFHQGNALTEKMLAGYGCPVDIITHGDLPHRVLKKHGEDHE